MGVPAFFRWLSRKYVSIIVDAVEERRIDVEGVKIPIDCTQPNPNYQEFDNLYLDMNGIIHPCTHPEHAPAPKTEEEMFVLIFQYIDRLFSIVRPRKLLYMAIDGVAPRAKMNQQRSRRFRASKEAAEKREQIATIRKRLESKGIPLPPVRKEEEHFDSNCITPGTPFMARLSDALRYYIHKRITYDPAWKKIQVILSDANAPGEGEHKIMDFIRRQRASPSHDPNTVHCLCGADADLIMLGLATHESNFNILREEFVPNQPKPCDLCAQYGHELEHCQGLAQSGKGPDQADPLKKEKNFIFIRLPVLREYLERELTMPNLPFPFDLERAIDDWVMMCFFVGNDFLPHLPSLEIREGAIDRLVKLYKQMIYQTGGWLTEDGEVNVQRVQMIMTELGKAEDEIFKQRQMRELKFKESQKQKKRRAKETAEMIMPYNASFIATQPISSSKQPYISGENIRKMAAEDRQEMSKRAIEQVQKLKALLTPMPLNNNCSSSSVPIGTKRITNTAENIANSNEEPPTKSFKDDEPKSNRAPADEQKPSIVVTTSSGKPVPLARGAIVALVANEDDSDEEPKDGIRLWEAGWKDRYYQAKFEVSESDGEFRKKVACAYVEGLVWVLRYYYQGCISWTWYYPYHYAPFASDFELIYNLVLDFGKATMPFKPLEQLMGVFPAASRSHIPAGWRSLMTETNSPIVDFYPEQFEIDLNGKKFAWQGVALLPFVDEKRLLEALTTVYDTLTPEEQARNMTWPDRLFVGKQHTLFEMVHEVHIQGKNESTERIKEEKMQINGRENKLNLKDNEDDNLNNEEEEEKTAEELLKEEGNSTNKNGEEHCNNENLSNKWEPPWVSIDASLAYGMSGEVCYDQTATECDAQFVSMFRNSLDFGDIKKNNCIMVKFRDPQFPRNHWFKAIRLNGINELPRVLKPNNYQECRRGQESGQYRPQIGFSRDIPQATVSSSGHRMLNHHIFFDQPQSQQQRRSGPPFSYQQPPPPPTDGKNLPWHKQQNNQQNVPQNQQQQPPLNLQNGMFKTGQFASNSNPVQACTFMQMAMIVPPPAPPLHWTASNRRIEQAAGGGGESSVGQWRQPPPPFLQQQPQSNARNDISWRQNQQPKNCGGGDRVGQNRNIGGSHQQYPPQNQPQQQLPYHRTSNNNQQQQNRSFSKNNTGPREFRPSNRRSGQ